jgi:hypothetical protein
MEKNKVLILLVFICVFGACLSSPVSSASPPSPYEEYVGASNDTEKEEIIKKYGYSIVNSSSYDLLNEAVKKGNLREVEMLLKYGGDINDAILGNTPLLVAVEGLRLNIVKYLIQNGADTNYINDNGLTAMSLATFNMFTSYSKSDALNIYNYLRERTVGGVNPEGIITVPSDVFWGNRLLSIWENRLKENSTYNIRRGGEERYVNVNGYPDASAQSKLKFQLYSDGFFLNDWEISYDLEKMEINDKYQFFMDTIILFSNKLGIERLEVENRYDQLRVRFVWNIKYGSNLVVIRLFMSGNILKVSGLIDLSRDHYR